MRIVEKLFYTTSGCLYTEKNSMLAKEAEDRCKKIYLGISIATNKIEAFYTKEDAEDYCNFINAEESAVVKVVNVDYGKAYQKALEELDAIIDKISKENNS